MGMQPWGCWGDGLYHIGQRWEMILKDVDVSNQNLTKCLESLN